jgi:hypothetical protein
MNTFNKSLFMIPGFPGREVFIIMKPVQKLVSLCMLFALFAVVPKAEAAQLLNLRLSLGDSRPTTSNTHTFQFTHQTSTTIRQVSFSYCTAPSGVADACTKPASLVTTSATKGTLTGLTDGSWTLDATVDGVPVLNHTGAGQSVAAIWSSMHRFQAITNHAIDNCQPGGDTSSDTCYVRVRSYTALGSGLVDEGIVSYTVVSAVTVSARVDPSFSFVVEGVLSNVATNGLTTSVGTTFNTIPFGNLTAGIPKYAAHALRVTTNTQSGYTVSARLLTQLTGNYTMNNIDPFIAPWGTPTSWTAPTGTTPNDNSGWIGANTSDTDVAGWDAGSAKFGTVTTAQAYTVMQASGSDNGSVPVFVTYAIEANVFQPADTYSGILQYNALPTY